MTEQKKRGFANLDPARQREIAVMGGKSVPAKSRTFSQDPNLAVEAGRKSGKNVKPAKRSFSQDRTLAVEAGRKGAHARHHARAKAASKNGD